MYGGLSGRLKVRGICVSFRVTGRRRPPVDRIGTADGGRDETG